MDKPDRIPIGPLLRAGLLAWSVFLVAGFCVSARLQPSPQGFGTHQQLGLPPCAFQSRFQVPCPSCGMTTSFAHFVRGQWRRALSSSVTGFCLALVCAVQIPWCWINLRRRSLWLVRRPEAWLLAGLGGLYVIGVLEWCWRFAR